jgi:hypothetical protein
MSCLLLLTDMCAHAQCLSWLCSCAGPICLSACRSKLGAAEQQLQAQQAQLHQQQAQLEQLRQQLQAAQSVSPSSTAQRLQALLVQKDKDIQRLQQELQRQQRMADELQQQNSLSAPAIAAAGPASVVIDMPMTEPQPQQQRGEPDRLVASPEQLQRLLKVQSSRDTRKPEDGRGSTESHPRALQPRSVSGSAVKLSYSQQQAWPPAAAAAPGSQGSSVQQPAQQQQEGRPASKSLLTPAHLERSLHHSASSAAGSFASHSGLGNSSKQLSLAASRAQALPLEGPQQHHLEAVGMLKHPQQQEGQGNNSAGPAAAAGRSVSAGRAALAAAAAAGAHSANHSRRLRDQSQAVAATLLAESSGSDLEADSRNVDTSRRGLLTASELLAVASGGYDAERLRRSLSGTDPAVRASRIASIAAGPAHAATGAEAPGQSLAHVSRVEAVMRASSTNNGAEPTSKPQSRVESLVQRSASSRGPPQQNREPLPSANANPSAPGQLGTGSRLGSFQAAGRSSEAQGVRAFGSGSSLGGSRKQQQAVLHRAAQLLDEDSD